jgi:hypothetical protein
VQVALDIFQQVFCLSMEIGAAHQATGTVESLETQLTTSFNKLFGNANFGSGWELVWGPVVWQSPYSNVVDQATAVCYNATSNYYVVPIAATSPISPFMVLIEDLAVIPLSYMRPYPPPTQNAGNLSYGNYVALEALQNLTSNGQTLGQYLSGAASSSNSLVFCGHSLGGGLAPLLAYALYPQGTTGSKWQNVYTYPTAGPSTADVGFQGVFNEAYPIVTPSGFPAYGQWNANQYNGRDVVPHAWSVSNDGPNLKQITAGIGDSVMFQTSFQMGFEVTTLQTIAVNYATGTASSDPYMQTNNNLLWTAAQQTVPITTNAELVAEISYQHVAAYIDEFGVGSVISAEEATQNIAPPLQQLVRAVAGAGAKVAAAQAEAAARPGA